MQYSLTPYAVGIEPWAYWDNAFSEEELNWLQDKAKDNAIKAKVGDVPGGALDSKIRRSSLSWLHNTPESEWVFKKLAHVVSSLNASYFRFDLNGFGEPIQLTNYDESENGMYGWHVDFGAKNAISRKLSLVIQLSDAVDYEGGVLELQPSGKEIISMSKQRGKIVVFPSWTLHQVTPVTKGLRQSLVAWISGPAFK